MARLESAPWQAPVNQSEEENQNHAPSVSVVVLNFNGAPWLDRCLSSLRNQTIFGRLEVIVADNNSPDRSDLLAQKLVAGWRRARVIQHGVNLGFCEGNNRAAAHARGEFLFFLNNDTWLEPDCMERLLVTVESSNSQAGTPLMLDYEDDSIQSSGGAGFDIFGLMSLAPRRPTPGEIFVVGGCSYLIERELFNRLGGFDPVFYMYADEYDLSWRLWAAGGRAILVPGARLHHRGAAAVNPVGGGKVIELRTSDSKRFYTNRNCLLLLLKNCQHILLLMVPLQVALLLAEGLVGMLLLRRWSFFKKAYLDAIFACWRLRPHVKAERRRLAALRKRSDWAMLRFFRLRLNRWEEVRNVQRHGLPKVSPK
ncbi:MAG TPA: glycosyltransferase family 2 protein [Verrucomicrobiae bacterium]|nr:glycosyltransferase family 2 protein [Verrucomicrobiae bacterium]